MVGILSQREQRQVQRFYYPGEFIPNVKDWLADVKAKCPALRGFEPLEVVITRRYDLPQTPWQVIGLFERDGSTLEAKALQAEEREAGMREDGRFEE